MNEQRAQDLRCRVREVVKEWYTESGGDPGRLKNIDFTINVTYYEVARDRDIAEVQSSKDVES